MSDPKQEEDAAPAPLVASFIRPHEAEPIDVTPNPISSATALEAAVDDCDEFLDRWLARHFSLSVKLHDAHRESDAGEPIPAMAEMRATLDDLVLAQGVLLELYDYAAEEPRIRALMADGRLLQHGVIVIYNWLSETVGAIAARAVARRRSSFVDDGEGTPTGTMLRTLERLHPDLEQLVRADAIPVDRDVAEHLSLCFRQIGAAVVRISGRAVTMPPPP